MKIPDLTDALAAAKENRIHKWVISFLIASGNNLALADTLEQSGQYLYGPIDYPLKKLVNLIGPDDSFKYQEDVAELQARVNNIVRDIHKGWQPPPLIATNLWEDYLELADGGHRYMAFQSLGVDEYPTIFYFRDESTMDDFIRTLPKMLSKP